MVYTLEEIREKIKPAATKYNVRSIYLFGSYAKGNATEKSDIDLLTDSGLKGIKFYGFLDALTNIFNKDIDLIDIREISERSELSEEIKKTGILVYEHVN